MDRVTVPFRWRKILPLIDADTRLVIGFQVAWRSSVRCVHPLGHLGLAGGRKLYLRNTWGLSESNISLRRSALERLRRHRWRVATGGCAGLRNDVALEQRR